MQEIICSLPSSLELFTACFDFLDRSSVVLLSLAKWIYLWHMLLEPEHELLSHLNSSLAYQEHVFEGDF